MSGFSLSESLMRFFCLSPLPGSRPGAESVPGRVLKAIYVRLREFVTGEDGEIIASGNIHFVWFLSSIRREGVVFHVDVCCVCVCSQHEEKEKALKEQLSHLTALLPTLQVQ